MRLLSPCTIGHGNSADLWDRLLMVRNSSVTESRVVGLRPVQKLVPNESPGPGEWIGPMPRSGTRSSPRLLIIWTAPAVEAAIMQRPVEMTLIHVFHKDGIGWWFLAWSICKRLKRTWVKIYRGPFKTIAFNCFRPATNASRRGKTIEIR